jgi:hypothetical protein
MLAGAKAALFLSGTRLPPQAWGMSQLVRIQVFHDSLPNVEAIADRYIAAQPGRLKVPFGIHDREYTDLLRQNLSADPQVAQLNGRRVWLAVGSGTLLSVLLDVLPQSTFLAFQVGKALPEFLAKNPRVTTFWAEEKFAKPAEVPPPFRALSNYDAKVWRQVVQDGQNGDAIWIVM